MERVVVAGLGVTGRAVASALVARSIHVDAIDDAVTAEMTAWGAATGVEVSSPDAGRLASLLRGADALLPTPGLPEHHPVFDAARSLGVGVYSELDLAHRWDDRPIVAVTGTDGKTTVVTLIERMLDASGKPARAVGNTETPLVAAIDDPTTEVFVVEASSFRLGHSQLFSPQVATWLNFGPDHLDAHDSIESYEAAKASIWARLADDAVAIANRDDPVVMAHANRLRGVRVETFGTSPDAPHGVVGSTLVVAGQPLLDIEELGRRLPHDQMNALAAAASAIRAGACRDAVASVLRGFTGLPHRVQMVAEIGGVRFVNDSKATTPHAAEAAIQAFDSVVLLAGGRNKGLDLEPITRHHRRLKHVVALGEATTEIEQAFDPLVATSRATSMEEAVDMAVSVAVPGDVVLLSPACASFDWYRSYVARGEHFTAIVRARAGSEDR